MNSFQVIACGFSNENYSELKIIRSSAGFYIGTVYQDPIMRYEEPGSRDSDYFVHKEQAELALEKQKEFYANASPEDKEDWTFISNWENWLYKEGLDPRCVGYRMYP